MALRSRKTVEASALAEQHGAAVVKRENAIMRANAEYETQRQVVIETGTQRVAEIEVLQRELDKERAALVGVLQDPSVTQA